MAVVVPDRVPDRMEEGVAVWATDLLWLLIQQLKTDFSQVGKFAEAIDQNSSNLRSRQAVAEYSTLTELKKLSDRIVSRRRSRESSAI